MPAAVAFGLVRGFQAVTLTTRPLGVVGAGAPLLSWSGGALPVVRFGWVEGCGGV